MRPSWRFPANWSGSSRTAAIADLSEVFQSFTSSLWRWECQGYYASDEPAVEMWRRGLARDRTQRDRWLDYIARVTSEGRSFRRVRVLTEPINEYLRWMIEGTAENIAAGEDIRWLWESEAANLGLPTYDFYLVDDSRVAVMEFDADKRLTGVRWADSAAVVAEHQSYRDAAVGASMAHATALRARG